MKKHFLENGSVYEVVESLSEVKDTVAVDFYFKNMFFSTFNSHFYMMTKLTHLKELMLFELCSFETVINDLQTLLLPSLESLNMSAYSCTVE